MNISSKAKAVAHLSGGDNGDDLASSRHHHDKRIKDQKSRGKEMVAAANHTARPQPCGHAARHEHFEKALIAPYTFHGG